jgi:hypothetical protein
LSAQTQADERPLTIGEVSRRSGVKATTLRYYESLGVLPEPDRVARAHAFHRWLEVASVCDCETLDVCGLFDDSALGVREQGEPAGRGALRVIPPG